MIIIIEGIDRVGKTTLANIISNKFNIPILKQERFGGNELIADDYNDGINYGRLLGLIDFWNWNHFNDNLIMDRFHWTEAVYGLLSRNNPAPMSRIPTVEMIMKQHMDKYLIIQVMPTDIEWSNKQHGSDLSYHQELFNTLYDACTLNKIRCDHLTFEYALSKIERMLKYGS